MKKSVSFGAKPTTASEKNPEEWVMNRTMELGEPYRVESAPQMKRLTIDVPADLHAKMKSRCALNGVKMADEVRALLARHFGENE